MAYCQLSNFERFLSNSFISDAIYHVITFPQAVTHAERPHPRVDGGVRLRESGVAFGGAPAARRDPRRAARQAAGLVRRARTGRRPRGGGNY